MSKIVVTEERDLRELIQNAVKIAMENAESSIQQLEERFFLTKDWYTEKEAAKYLGISNLTLANKRRAGKVKAKKFGGGYRYDRETLNNFIENEEG